MRMRGKCLPVFLVFFLFAGGCTRQTETVSDSDNLSDCHIIFDAGSKGTRLYVYQRTDTGWLKHRGPKTVALAEGPLKEEGLCFYSGAFKLLLPDQGTYDLSANWDAFNAEESKVAYNTTVLLELTE